MALILLLIGLCILFAIYQIWSSINTDNKMTEQFIRSVGDVDFHDPYSTAKIYENDPGKFGELGIYKCIANCKGNCVEYGVTGSAWCFE